MQIGLPSKVSDLCQIYNWARTVTGNKALHFLETGRRLPLLDGVSLGWVHAHRSGLAIFSGRLNDEAKVLDLMHFKVTLGNVNLQACLL